MSGKIALVVQGLYELSDSIGYDCVAQYRKIKDAYAGTADVRIFAERIAASRYPDVPIEFVGRLWPWLQGEDDAIVIYHFCDGWPSFEIPLASLRSRLIVRWHNNTPPWFFAQYAPPYVARTIRGYDSILNLANLTRTEYWANSSYSARQLSFLGIEDRRIHVVYPISTYIGAAPAPRSFVPRPKPANSFRVLFVGRVVPHKGHKHVIAACAVAQRATGRQIELAFAGRADTAMMSYVDEIRVLAEELGVSMSLHGEIANSELAKLYSQTNVFACLSEHEGFGLPIFEAMRLDIPVVGLCSTALRDFLGHHPLAVDSVDYPGIALRLIAAADPEIRDAVVEWQRTNVLVHYDDGVVTRQLADGLRNRHARPSTPAKRSAQLDGMLNELELGARPKLQQAAAALFQLRRLPIDIPDRMITRYDLDAYAGMISGQRADRSGDFYETVMATEFRSSRRILGPPLKFARRAALSLQSGLIQGLGRLNIESRAQFDRLDNSVTTLKLTVASLKNAIESLSALRAANLAPASSQSPPSSRDSRSNVLADNDEFVDTASPYGQDCCKGNREYTGSSLHSPD